MNRKIIVVIIAMLSLLTGCDKYLAEKKPLTNAQFTETMIADGAVVVDVTDQLAESEKFEGLKNAQSALNETDKYLVLYIMASSVSSSKTVFGHYKTQITLENLLRDNTEVPEDEPLVCTACHSAAEYGDYEEYGDYTLTEFTKVVRHGPLVIVVFVSSMKPSDANTILASLGY